MERRDANYVEESDVRQYCACKPEEPLTPGSETEAWMNEDMETRKRYAKRMGIDGEMLSQSHGALKFLVRSSQHGPWTIRTNKQRKEQQAQRS